MNRGHRNFKSAHKRVVLARLQAHEELQPRDTRGFGRSRPPRSHERLIAAKIAPTLVAVAFSERSHIARPLANDRMHSPVGEVSSNPTGVMIQRGSGEQLRVGMGEYGNHGKAREPSSARTWARTASTTIDCGGGHVDALLVERARFHPSSPSTTSLPRQPASTPPLHPLMWRICCTH